MAKLTSSSIPVFLKKLASAGPVPGGGAAAALVVAQAVALTEMVAGLNAKRARKKGEDPVASLKNSRLLSRYRIQLLALLEKDAEAFEKLSKFGKQARQGASYASALKKAATVPIKMTVIAEAGAGLAVSEANRTSRWLYSDILEATLLFEAGFQAARLNAEINLEAIKDASFVKSAVAGLDSAARRIETAHRRVAEGRP